MSLNGAKALRSLDGNLELLKELAAIFSEDSSEVLSDFKSAVTAQDAAGARLAAHSLKGMTCNFYATDEIEQIAFLEQAAVEENWEVLADASQTLEQIVQRLLTEMRSENWIR